MVKNKGFPLFKTDVVVILLIILKCQQLLISCPCTMRVTTSKYKQHQNRRLWYINWYERLRVDVYLFF